MWWARKRSPWTDYIRIDDLGQDGPEFTAADVNPDVSVTLHGRVRDGVVYIEDETLRITPKAGDVRIDKESDNA